MAKLNEDVQTLIVNELACFRTPSEVADLVKEAFGLVVDRRQVQLYDPDRAGKKPADRWCALFTATRAQFLKTKAGLAISHRNWRLRELEDMARAAKKRKDYRLARELLEQAAKEEGEVYTNHRAKEPVSETDEQRVARMRATLAEMDEKTLGAPSLAIVRDAAVA